MELTRLSELRPRGVWDLLDDAFDLYRERFALLAGIAAVPFVPSYLLNTLVTTLAFKRFQASMSDASSTEIFVPFLIFAGASIVGQPILIAARAIQYAATAAVLEDRLKGGVPAARPAWKRTMARFFPLLLASLAATLVISLVHAISCGTLTFLALPLVALIPACIVLEKRSLSDGFRRGWNLGMLHFGRGLGLNLLILLLEFALEAGLSALVMLVFSLIPGQKSGLESSSSFVSTQAAQAVAALFIAPLGGVATTLFYYDCQVRREGLDIAALAAESDVPLAEVPQ